MIQNNKYRATAGTACENTIICVEDARQIERNMCMDAHTVSPTKERFTRIRVILNTHTWFTLLITGGFNLR